MQTHKAAPEFERQRQVLDMLNITVWLDGKTVEVAGTIDPENAAIVRLRSVVRIIDKSQSLCYK